MELIRRESIHVLSNSGVESEQLLCPGNSSSKRLTVTRVTMPPGKVNPRHVHPSSEQVWIAVSGEGTLLLGEDRTESLCAGDVARFAEGEVHGFRNSGAQPFVYVAVTSPPIDFRSAYEKDRASAIAKSEA